MSKRTMLLAAVGLLVAGFIAWQVLSGDKLPHGLAKGNGRLEANEVFISAKRPGRLAQVLVREGDTVQAGQIVARLDTSELDAQLRQAEAQIREARQSEQVARAEVGSKAALVGARRAQIAARQADFQFAQQQYDRSRGLVGRGAVSEQEAQLDASRMYETRAQVAGSRADLAAAAADVTGTQALVGRSASTIVAAAAEADRIRAEIKDAVLVAPLTGRVERRLAEEGEVVGAGGRVFSMVDLSDVYMYVFLPEPVVGKLRVGSEARIVLDAAPQYPIRATVSYISPTAQFTPKTVETQEERHNLTFRVKLQIPQDRLKLYQSLVKAGVPGVGYVKFDNGATWPATLQPPAKMPANLFGSENAAG